MRAKRGFAYTLFAGEGPATLGCSIDYAEGAGSPVLEDY